MLPVDEPPVEPAPLEPAPVEPELLPPPELPELEVPPTLEVLLVDDLAPEPPSEVEWRQPAQPPGSLPMPGASEFACRQPAVKRRPDRIRDGIFEVMSGLYQAELGGETRGPGQLWALSARRARRVLLPHRAPLFLLTPG